MTRALCWLAAAVVVLACGWFGWLAVRTWRASADTATAQALALARGSERALPYLARAVNYRPGQAAAWRLRAEFSAFAHPHRALRYARRSVAVDPLDWRNWDQLGLIELQLNQTAAARRALAQAVRYDSGWKAHFQLGNLALLLGDEPEFWAQMRAALSIVGALQAEPLLQEAVGVAGDHPRAFLEALPPARADVDARAVRLLVRRRRPLEAEAVWERMRCQGYQRADCRSAVLALANGLLAAAYRPAASSLVANAGAATPRPRRPAGASAARLVFAALSAWNRAVQRRVLEADNVRVGAVSDGAFEHRWVGPAFAWAKTSPVYLSRELGVAPVGNAVRINFDGYEPEDTGLLQELVAVRPGATYAISYWARRQGDGSQTGVQ
ncbi:MAG: hypothetical protein ACRD13_09860, partial [Terriglobales bacterium]